MAQCTGSNREGSGWVDQPHIHSSWYHSKQGTSARTCSMCMVWKNHQCIYSLHRNNARHIRTNSNTRLGAIINTNWDGPECWDATGCDSHLPCLASICWWSLHIQLAALTAAAVGNIQTIDLNVCFIHPSPLCLCMGKRKIPESH